MLNIGLKDNLCVVDIGTNKIITINYKITENGLLKIDSINHKKSEGIERSFISSKSKFFQTVLRSLADALPPNGFGDTGTNAYHSRRRSKMKCCAYRYLEVGRAYSTSMQGE